jgi:hypothetical protein
MAEVLTPELRRFILAAMPSVPHLEALLLLREREAGWRVGELGARLYVGEAAALALIDDLAQAGLAVQEDGTARYAPARPDLRDTVDLLAQVYARHVVAVSELIHSTTGRKAHSFADAFRLRKDTE